MAYKFQQHYTRDEAQALLPQVRQWLERLPQLRDELQKMEEEIVRMMTPPRDLGGEQVNAWVRTLAAIRELLLEFHRREIQLKDVDRGLVDFPAILNDREVFLCWEKSEAEIEYWHELETGYAGRQPL